MSLLLENKTNFVWKTNASSRTYCRASVLSLGKASLEQLLQKHVSNVSKGTDNSKALF